MINPITFSRKTYIPKPSKKWVKNDEGCTRFYTYILKLENDRFYVGHTRELLPRVLEHKESITRSTAGGRPKLRYFEILSSREAAQLREHELKFLLSHNRREFFRIIAEFQTLLAQVDMN